MEEKIMENVQEKVSDAIEAMTDAMIDVQQQVAPTPVVTMSNPIPQPKSYVGKNTIAAAGFTVGGIAIGIAVDHWLVPKAQEMIKNPKAKKAEKKAAKEAKKAAKAAEKEPKKAEPATSEKPDSGNEKKNSK